ncbi:recombinase family protein [Sporomusa acidovorans]|uniref:DNA-invertase hin n=1 Tax=Sporomusa acidovorans (strain ATCC 49682 / DSM 3132 / Mol) TaxID=1123286 RepID=A0ABZ3IVP7_SPOA4|nr:recombinase family protein [Sporomusa acidovorans]OZC17987.1 DNA-invertase hin [Sporomusa acidovorans DSM 3132]SDF42154.1 Resolvase, N terminal domain [Sporomusa acidovorans]
MNIGYVSISKYEQNPYGQLQALRRYHVERIFKDRIYGKGAARPQRMAMLDSAGPGDTVYIESISRLAQDTIDFRNIIERFKAKEVGLVSIKEEFDTTSPTGRLLAVIFAATQFK